MFKPEPLFKTDRIRTEYENGGFCVRSGTYVPTGASADILEGARFIPIHHDVYPLIWAVDFWHYRETGGHVQITDLGRTRQEQIILYLDDPRYINDPESVFVSPHEDGRAFDFSIRQIIPDRRRSIESYLRQRYIYIGSTRYKVAILHDVAGLHVHVQISPAANQFLPEGDYTQ